MGNKDTFLYNKFYTKAFPRTFSGEAFFFEKLHCIFPLFVKEFIPSGYKCPEGRVRGDFVNKFHRRRCEYVNRYYERGKTIVL